MNEETFEKTRARLFVWFTRRGVMPTLAEDLTSETFLRVMQAGKTDERMPYYYTAARSALVDHVRKTHITEQLVDIFAVRDEYFEEGEDVLEHLDDRTQTVVRLIAAGFRYRDVGAQLGLSPSGITRIVRKARKVTPRAIENRTSKTVYGGRSRSRQARPENQDRHERTAVA